MEVGDSGVHEEVRAQEEHMVEVGSARVLDAEAKANEAAQSEVAYQPSGTAKPMKIAAKAGRSTEDVISRLKKGPGK
jgi:hypothetical protein